MSYRLEKMRQRSLDEGLFSNYCNKVIKDIKTLANAVFHSSNIEGSTLTEADTLTLLTAIHVDNENAQHLLKEEYSTEELNFVSDLSEATEMMYDNIENSTLDEEFIKELHALACASDKAQDAGEYKTFRNYTTRRGEQKLFMEPEKVPMAMIKLVSTYNKNVGSLENIAKLKLEFIHIHPFADGNGRVSRLLLNWALMSNEYPPIVIRVDEKARYIDCLNDYGDSEDPEMFISFLEEKLIEVYEEMLS